MTKLKYIIPLILLALVLNGASCGGGKESSSSEEELKEEISILLENLEQETGIDFSAEQEVEFPWYIEIDGELNEMFVQGKGFEIKGVSSQDYKKIEPFFIDNGFEPDIYNLDILITDSAALSLIGYQKAQIICTVVRKMWLDQEGISIKEEDRNDVEVKCGKII